MQKINILKKEKLLVKFLRFAIAVISSVLLPQVFHAIGVISGTGAALGTALLPMHIPVILSGFMYGPYVGLFVGLCSPLISFLISGMPNFSLLLFITVELAVYGLSAGYISKLKINKVLQLVSVQFIGRIARALVFVGVALINGTSFNLKAVLGFVSAGLFGIVLQLAIIPLLISYLESKKDERFN